MTDWDDLVKGARRASSDPEDSDSLMPGSDPGDGLAGSLSGGSADDWKGGEYSPEGGDPDRKLFDPPIERVSVRRPSYRQWLQTLAHQRNVFLVVHAGFDADYESLIGPVLDKLTTKELRELAVTEKWPDSVVDTLAALRREYPVMKAFAMQVLGGGPEGVWLGKPLDPKSVHSDVEAFYAAGRPGMTRETVDGSTKCWEVYDRFPIKASAFSMVAALLEEEDTRRKTVEVEIPPAAPVASGSPGASEEASGSTPDEVEPGSIASSFDRAMKSVADVYGTDTEHETMTSYDRRGRKIEETILETADKALVERIGTREYRDSGTNPALPPRVRCTYIRKTKKFGDWQCGHWSVYGSDRCEAHGGDLIDPEETKSLIRNSQQKIFGASLAAVGTIVDIMQNSTNDATRLRAAETILNRSGLNENVDVSVSLGVDDIAKSRPAGELIRERLMKLAGHDPESEAATRALEEADRKKFEAIDAEVVEEPAEVIVYESDPGDE